MNFQNLIDAIRHSTTIPGKGLTFIGAQQDTFVSYETLYNNALRALGHLQQSTNNSCRELVFQVDDNELFITSFMACILGNIIPVPLATGNENDCRTKLRTVWKDLSNPYLLIDNKNEDRLNQYCKLEQHQDFLNSISIKTIKVEEVILHTEVGQVASVEPGETAFVQYSSGATGTPKGSVVTHRNVIVNATEMIERVRITNADRSISWLPLTHDFGLICVFLTNLIAGIQQYIIHQSLFIRRPLLWLEKASQYKASLLYTPNFGLQYVVNAMAGKNFTWNFTSIRAIYNGAEPIIDSITKKFMLALQPYQLPSNAMFPVYGMAEATVGISLPEPGDQYEVYTLLRNQLVVGHKVAFAMEDHSDQQVIKFIEVGMPLPSCHMRICDDDDAELKDLFVGNIQLKGASIVSGYYNNRQDTEQLFTSDGWLRTGDLGFMRSGRVVITGRKKNMIIINGQNYYPQDIESAAFLEGEINYGEVVACGIPSQDNLGEDLVLFITCKGTKEEQESICGKLREKVFKSFGLMVKDIIILRKFPKTTSGKIQNFKLKELYLGVGNTTMESLTKSSVV